MAQITKQPILPDGQGSGMLSVEVLSKCMALHKGCPNIKSCCRQTDVQDCCSSLKHNATAYATPKRSHWPRHAGLLRHMQ